MIYTTLLVVQWLRKELLTLKWTLLGPKTGQNKVLGLTLVLNALVLPNFAHEYYE